MEDLVIIEKVTRPEEVRLHRGHMTNGIPSWAIPSSVRWNGECRRWYRFVPEWIHPVDHPEITDYHEHIPDYPCQIEDLVGTQEYLKILERAEIDAHELHGDLQRRMRVIKWLHHCNVEVARKWEAHYSKFSMNDILSHPMWQDMGNLLKEKESKWKASNGEGMERTLLFCDLDGVLTDFEKGVKKLFHGRKPKNSATLWAGIRRSKDFFETLEWRKDGEALWSYIKDLEPIIMTGVPPGSWAIEQKMNWLKREIGDIRVTFCKSKDKSIYKPDSVPHAILIDDRDFLRDQWEKSGGIFIHHTNALDTLKQLQSTGLIEEIDLEYLDEHWGLKDTGGAQVEMGEEGIQL